MASISTGPSSRFLFPKSGVSLVSQSVFEAISFSCEQKGTIFALETPGGKNPQLIDLIFTYAMQQPSPVWHHITDLGSHATEIAKKDFYFRALQISECGFGFEVLSLAQIEMLFFNSLYQMLDSCFFSKDKLPHARILNFKNDPSAPSTLSYEGVTHQLRSSKKNIHYVLELSTSPDAFYQKLIFSKLLHQSMYDQWIKHIPAETDRLKGILLFISKNQEEINKILLKSNKVILNLSAEADNRTFVLIKKIGHKLEAFFIKGHTAYGLTNFTDYEIKHIKDEEGFNRISRAYQARSAYCKIFATAFEFRFNEDSKYVAFKMKDWSCLLDAIIGGAAYHSSLKTREVDHAIMTWVKTLVSLHQGGCQLKELDFRAMFCKTLVDESTKDESTEFKIMLTESVPFTDGTSNVKSFALLLYQLWVRYKLYQDVSCFSKPVALTPELEAAIIRECAALQKSDSCDAYIDKKLGFIQKLFTGTMTLIDFSRNFELAFNSVYFGVEQPKNLVIEDIK